MRSAGCIVNDIVDEKIDRKVERTKNRPIASGKLNKSLAWIYVLILCLLAFLVLIQFNFLTISLGAIFNDICIFISFYEKIYLLATIIFRFTFNWGIIMAWAAIMNDIAYLPILLYLWSHILDTRL